MATEPLLQDSESLVHGLDRVTAHGQEAARLLKILEAKIETRSEERRRESKNVAIESLQRSEVKNKVDVESRLSNAEAAMGDRGNLADVAERLRAIDTEVSLLASRIRKTPNGLVLESATTPLLHEVSGASPIRQLSPTSTKSTPRQARETSIATNSSLESLRDNCSVDFDIVFKFPNTNLIENLTHDCEVDDLDARAKALRQKALDQAKAKLEEDDIFLTKNLSNLVQRGTGENRQNFVARRRMPLKPEKILPGYQTDPQVEAGGIPRKLQELFRGFLVEKRDRDSLQVPSNLGNVTDARRAALHLLISFLTHDKDSYETFFFSTMDHSELILCVRLTDEAAADHAYHESANVEVRNDKLPELDIQFDDPELRVYAKYTPYMEAQGMYKGHEIEADLEALHSRRTRFRKTDRIQLLYDKITDVIDVDAMMQWRLFNSYYPAHSLERLNWHRDQWGQFVTGFKSWIFEPPLDEIQEYYGPHIAMYYLFSSELCHALCKLVMACGIVTLLVAVMRYSLYEALFGFIWGRQFPKARFAYACITLLWTHYLEYRIHMRVNAKMIDWGQRSSLDHSDIKNLGAKGFRGFITQSEVDSRDIDVDVPYRTKRRGRWKAFVVTGCFSAISVLSIVSIYLVAAWLGTFGYKIGFQLAGFAVTAALKILQFIWGTISLIITDWEYNRYELPYRDSWAGKTIVIHAISSFTGFTYVGFFMDKVTLNGYTMKCPDSHVDCFGYLCYQMTTVFTSFIALAFVDAIRPPIMMKWNLQRKQTDLKKKGHRGMEDLSFLEIEAAWDDYSTTDQAEDYCQHLIPLAFVLLFGITMPLSCVLALIVSTLQAHVDAYNITHTMQRPYPMKTQGLTRWTSIIEAFSTLAIYSNVAIICVDLDPLKSAEWKTQLLAFLTGSTVLLLIRVAIKELMPGKSDKMYMDEARQVRVWQVADKLHSMHATKLLPPDKVRQLTRDELLEGRQPHPTSLLDDADALTQACVLEARADGTLPDGEEVKSIKRLHPESPYFENAKTLHFGHYEGVLDKAIQSGSSFMG